MKITNIEQLKVGQHFTIYTGSSYTKIKYECVCDKIINNYSDDKKNSIYFSYITQDGDSGSTSFNIYDAKFFLDGGEWTITCKTIIPDLPDDLFTMDVL